MDMRRELVKFIDDYGHDFLNHLQVISGMAQLDNPDGVREYVLEVTGRIREINQVAKVGNATVAALLLIFYGRAARYGVPVLFTVHGSPVACAVSDAELGATLEPIFGRLAALILPSLEGTGETVELALNGTGNECAISFMFPVEKDASIDGLGEMPGDIDRAMRKIGGGSVFSIRHGEVRLMLRFPRREV